MNLSIATEAHEDVAVLHIGGDLDIYTAPQLKDALDSAGLAGRTTIVDLSEVHFIDSTALGVLVSELQRSRAREGELSLVLDDPYLLKIFRITGFDGLFSIFPQVADALAAV